MTAFIGKPLSRRDGPSKVTGQATYAAEFLPSGLVHAVLVPAAIANGRASVDAAAAEQASGVLRVLTADSFPWLDLEKVGSPPLGQKLMPLQDDRVLYQGQAIALVIAETLERAEAASQLIEAKYEALPPLIFGSGEARLPQGGMSLAPHEEISGDIEAGLSEAEVMVEGEYTLPSRHHNPMEPSATIAAWSGDQLTMHTATQWTYGVRYALAPLLGLPPADIRVVCPFTGGGFGCKGWVWPHQVIAAVAAREIGRPLKLVLSRAQMYTETGYQPAMRNKVTIGAKRGGQLTAIRHETTNITSAFEDYIEHGVAGTRGLYAAPNRQFVTKVEPANVGTPTPMRAPHEGPGMFALETAMDELAYAIGLDPVELRLANDTQVDPANGKPFSSRKLRECLMEGAERFGWSPRPLAPRSLRDGNVLVGQGVASAIMTTFRMMASARARLRADGTVFVESGSQEIGTGTSTIFPQIAAEVLAVDPALVTMRLGDTDLPEAGVTAGSSSTISVGSAVHAAAAALRQRLVDLALQQPDSPLHGLDPQRIAARDGGLAADDGTNRFDLYSHILARAGIEEMAADGRWAPNDQPFDAEGGKTAYSMRTFGAVFAEVAVDPDFGIVRMRRLLGVYNAGQIINPKTATSQMTGGLIWGIGQALLEESTIEPRYGCYLSKNLAGYMVPVNADVQGVEAYFVDDYDRHASAIGARGLGELGAVGVSAAIGNAVFHATGKRIRDLPIRMEHVMA
jgi:xanthine dehydrogenase YagR molybdenum-binding subunit